MEAPCEYAPAIRRRLHQRWPAMGASCLLAGSANVVRFAARDFSLGSDGSQKTPVAAIASARSWCVKALGAML
jgi:hypothetical protein